MPKLLNTDHFETIVSHYQLEHALEHFKLFNMSKYINSYHGYEHAKKLICSLHYLTQRHVDMQNLKWNTVRNMMIAAVFHDFNYVGTDFSNPEYDTINVTEAIRAFSKYFQEIKTSKHELSEDAGEFIMDLILDTNYPKCMDGNISKLSKIFVACDHSMVLYENYAPHGCYFCYNECGIHEYSDAVPKNADSYFSKLKFSVPEFQAIWDEHSGTIKDVYYKELPHFYACIKNEQNNPTFSAYGWNFEVVTPNYE